MSLRQVYRSLAVSGTFPAEDLSLCTVPVANTQWVGLVKRGKNPDPCTLDRFPWPIEPGREVLSCLGLATVAGR